MHTKHWLVSALLTLAALLPFSQASAATTDPKAVEAIALMTKKLAGVETLEMDLILSGAALPGGSTGNYIGQPKNKTFRMNMSMKDQKQTFQSQTVSDGEIIWTESPAGSGLVVVTKQAFQDIPKDSNPDPISDFWALQDNYDFVSVKADDFDGEKVTVVDAKFKTEKKTENLEVETVRIYLRQTDHFPRKIDHLNAEGRSLVSIELRAIKINAGLPQNAFKYAPPVGAKVVDMKDMPNFGK